MKTVFSIAAVAAVFAGCAAVASADTGSAAGVSLRVGAFLPTESDTVTNGGPTWFAAGIDYKLPWVSLPFVPKGSYSVSLDYAGKGSYRNAPLLLNWTTGSKVYFTVGAGISFSRFPLDGGGEDDRVRFAYAGGIGYNFASEIPTFIEVRYLGNDMPRLGGVGIYVGARF